MKIATIAAILVLGASSYASAGVLAQWDLDPFSYDASNVDANIATATPISLVGLNPVGDGFDGVGIEVEGAQSSFVDYISATITAAPGFAIDLNGGSLTAVVDFVNGSGAAWRADAIFDSSTTVVLDQSVNREDDINAAITGVPTAQEIELRVYFANASWGDYQIGDIVLSGEIVPEPASLALLGMGGLLMLRRR